MKSLFLTLLFSLACHQASAVTGNELLSDLQSESSRHSGMMYVIGATDMLRTASALNTFMTQQKLPGEPCIPPTATNGQAVDIVRKHLEANPEDRHLLASGQIFTALRNAFPCVVIK